MSDMADGGEPHAEAIIKELWETHSRAVPGGTFGVGVPFQEFYCETCRMPYPCSVAQTIANWGTGHDYKFLTLRCPVEGEVVTVEPGRVASAQVGGHTWAIGKAIPTVVGSSRVTGKEA